MYFADDMKRNKLLLILALSTLASCAHQKDKSEMNDDKDTTGIKTEYYYEEKNKVKYPIYLSKSGRAYVVKQNGGRMDKIYLPEKYNF